MKNHVIDVLCLISLALLAGTAIAQDSVKPVPGCGAPQIQDGTLFIVNSCNITVSVTYTSLDDVWGGTLIGPGQSARTAYSAEAVNRVGGVHVYTCPGYGTPVQPDGSPIMAGNYTGSVYGCHGSAQDESGLNSQMPSQQAQQSVSTVQANTLVIPAGNVQQSNIVQQPTAEDDDDAQNADADNDDTEADSSPAPVHQPAYQQEYQMMRQNLNAAMQEAARSATAQAARGTRANPSGNASPSECVVSAEGGRCR
jgi:hypothetical protein